MSSIPSIRIALVIPLVVFQSMPILNLAEEIAHYLPTHSDTNHSSGSAAGTVAAGAVGRHATSAWHEFGRVCCHAIPAAGSRPAIFSVERFSVLSSARMFSAGFVASFATETVRSGA
jgi:hypothetical protein